jgi:hypothetical protein
MTELLSDYLTSSNTCLDLTDYQCQTIIPVNLFELFPNLRKIVFGRDCVWVDEMLTENDTIEVLEFDASQWGEMNKTLCALDNLRALKTLIIRNGNFYDYDDDRPETLYFNLLSVARIQLICCDFYDIYAPYATSIICDRCDITCLMPFADVGDTCRTQIF